MSQLLQQFESELKAFLEFSYNASSEQDSVKRFNETETAAFAFIDNYLLNSTELIAGDVEHSTQEILNEFIQSKLK
ncbi:hypothetical protein [Flavobacterium defluvii]|uniref:Uncharacterized protein n=1 Tax=Flavobacterium defluvii TaxID=370979 RepID=A0A1M5IXS3_9FLAO|nr:hypothetical protein [Flavobacterium defluvii]SHG33096.1 hypothetical protein SAMN05443663_102543 [Flavobacterium defluvii]